MESRTPNEDPVLQLHLMLPYKIEPRRHPRVRGYLERGYRIVELQRVTDDEVLITLAAHDVSS